MRDTVRHNIGLSNKYAKTIHFVGEFVELKQKKTVLQCSKARYALKSFVLFVFFFCKLAMFFNVDFNVMFQELHISKKVAMHTEPKRQIYFTEAGIYIAMLMICNNMTYIINS